MNNRNVSPIQLYKNFEVPMPIIHGDYRGYPTSKNQNIESSLEKYDFMID